MFRESTPRLPAAPPLGAGNSPVFERAELIVPADSQPVRVAWLPDGRTRLIYSAVEGYEYGDLRIAGPQSRALYKSVARVRWSLVLPFRPGWSSASLGVPSHELRDRFLPLEDLWGRAARDLGYELAATPDAGGARPVLARLTRLLEARARATDELASARLARLAVGVMEDGDVRMAHVADRLGVTSRHLRRAFTESVGVGPKEFARAIRLQRAVRSAATSRDWARIATENGYCDQAHLIDDFRALAGLTPGAYFDDRIARPGEADCVAS